MNLKLLFIPLLFSILSCRHGRLDEAQIKEELEHLMSDSSYSDSSNKGIVENESVAIQIAEPILFNIYGKDNILDEKPYQVSLVDSLWVINGTLPLYTDGGCFFIVINKKDGKILGLTHAK